MSNRPSLTSKELIKVLRRKGFTLERVKGSHQLWINTNSGKRATIPMHNKDLPIGTFMAILRQAGIEKDEL
jgi:mRNA interferase HicA